MGSKPSLPQCLKCLELITSQTSSRYHKRSCLSNLTSTVPTIPPLSDKSSSADDSPEQHHSAEVVNPSDEVKFHHSCQNTSPVTYDRKPDINWPACSDSKSWSSFDMYLIDIFSLKLPDWKIKKIGISSLCRLVR